MIAFVLTSTSFYLFVCSVFKLKQIINNSTIKVACAEPPQRPSLYQEVVGEFGRGGGGDVGDAEGLTSDKWMRRRERVLH